MSNSTVSYSTGPWAIHPESPFEIVMDDDDICPLIATVNADAASVDDDQARADARLIAASPELFKALENLAFHAAAACSSDVTGMQRELTRMSIARAEDILAKARIAR